MIKLLCFFVIIFPLASAGTLQVVTSDFSPYQTFVGNKVEGITTEIVKEVIARAGETGEIRMYPWPRAYKIAQREPNLIIYSMARTPEREKMFKWIGVVAPFEVYFWKMSHRTGIKVKSMDDAKRYMSGGVFNDVKGRYLEKEVGFQPGRNLEYVGNDTLNIRKLFAGRIDLLPFDELSLPYKVRDAGYDVRQLTKLIKIDEISHNLYMAASLKTPDATVLKLSRALEEFKKTKKYKDIQAKIK